MGFRTEATHHLIDDQNNPEGNCGSCIRVASRRALGVFCLLPCGGSVAGQAGEERRFRI